MIMETYTLNDIKNQVYGEIGTVRRDRLEAELANLRVGLQIRKAREARRMTQSQLAEKIGKERSFISKVESDGKNLTLSTSLFFCVLGIISFLLVTIRFRNYSCSYLFR